MQLHAGTTLYAAPCAASILTDNISVSAGATDGCTGRITAFNLETLEVTSVRMDASCQEGLVSRSWVLCQCMRRLTGYNAQRYSRRMFPLMLGLQTHANWHHGARVPGCHNGNRRGPSCHWRFCPESATCHAERGYTEQTAVCCFRTYP